jgi:hypothetical protein
MLRPYKFASLAFFLVDAFGRRAQLVGRDQREPHRTGSLRFADSPHPAVAWRLTFESVIPAEAGIQLSFTF